MTMFPGIRRGVWAETLGFDATTFGRHTDSQVREGPVTRSVKPDNRREALAAVSPAQSDLDHDRRRRMENDDREKPLQLLERYSTAHDHPLPKMVRATVPTR
ncbi:hypothetical protein [Tropicimonas sp. IMCC6043]|uniref:hypothetical protein n=1 Tax=Tropicimonas sp. IMCC6043 TaxID=2510645 RepID=UPI00101BE121|nr:hypothetical protein [Tropicimonas sp. IMCC6043]RYH06894.1 hypothetical protein EU800_22220 [Tropicimonas sp. IMCC6043]